MKTEIITKPVWEARSIMTRIKPRDKIKFVSTISSSRTKWETGLSPFVLGPCKLYDGYRSLNMENGWQYSKVYEEHVTRNRTGGIVSFDPWDIFSRKGWANPKAVRYPMGKGAKPLFSYWRGECLDYIWARRMIYGPLYFDAVVKTDSFARLKEMYESRQYKEIVLLDYDVRDTRVTEEDLVDVLYNPAKKMGHAFVLKALLTNDPVLDHFIWS